MPSARSSPRGVAQLPWRTAKRATVVVLAVLAALSVVLAAVTGQDDGPAPADGPTATAPAPSADPADVRDTCAEALRRATALLDAQEDALDAYDDGVPDNFSRERAEARDFDRAGLHQAAEACRNAA